MNSDNGRIYYKISIDKSQLKADAQNVKNEFRSISSTVQSEGEKMDQIFNRTYKSALALFSLNEIRKFSNEIIGITGEFQQLNVAFETILNSKEKADQLMSQVVSFASTTPFQLTDTAQATKQLLAYGFASQDIIKDLRMLGDVASGVSAPIQDLVYLYGTLKTQGRAYTRDIMQFTSRGIPIIQQLANVMGVTEDKVQGLVEAGKVGFPEVEKAFQNLTQQGGMFYNLMDKQSKTITGQISNLEDNLDKMFNDIGSANEGLIDEGISGLNSLIEHYQDVIKAIEILVASVGSYKAATIAIGVVEKVQAKNEAIRIDLLNQKVEALKKTFTQEDANTSAKERAAEEERRLSLIEQGNEAQRQAAAEKTTLAKQASAKASQELAIAEKEYSSVIAQSNTLNPYPSQQEANRLKKESLVVEKARTKVKETNAAVDKAISNEAVVNARIEAEAVKKAEKEKIAAKEAEIASDRERLIASQSVTKAEVRAVKTQSILNKTLLNNPYVIAITGISMLISVLSIFDNKTKEAISVSSDFSDQLEETQKSINENFRAIEDAKIGTEEHAKAIQTVNDKYKDYLPNLLSEKSSLEEIKKAQDAVITSMAKNIAFKSQKNQLSELKSNVTDLQKEFYSQIDNASNKLDDNQKGQFKALIDQYKQEVTEAYKNLGYFPSSISSNVMEIFKQVSGTNLSGWDTSGITYAIKDLVTGENELSQKTKGLKKVYDSYLNTLGLTSPKTKKAINSFKTIDQQIKETKSSIAAAEAKLTKMRSGNSVSSIGQIKEQESTVSKLKQQLSTLTGIQTQASKKQLKIKQQKLDAVKELNNQEIQLEASKNKALIAMMNDGIAKQKATLKNNYQDLLTQYAQQEQSILNSINKKNNKKQGDSGYAISLSSYVESNPDDKEAATAYQSLLDLKMLADKKYVQDTEALDQKAAQSIKAIMNEVQERFLSDLDQRKKAINDYYDGKIKEAKAQNASQATIDELNKDRVLELNQTQSESAYKLSSFYKEAFGNIGKYGAATLKKLQSDIDAVINSAKQIKVGGQSMVQLEIPTDQIDKDGKKIKKTVNMTIEEFTELQKQANEVNNSVDQNNPFSAITKNFKQVQKAFKSGDKTGIAEAMETLNSSISDGSQLVNQWGDSLGQIFGSDVSDDIQLLTGLTQGVTNLGTGVAELASGDIVGGITNTLKGVAKIYSTLTKGAKEYHKAVKDYTEELLKLQLEYNKALNEQIRTQSDGTSVFYTDYTAEIQDASKAASQAIEQINKELSGSSIESFLSDLQIKTGVAKKKFLGITTGTKDIYGSLGENFNKVLSDAGYSFDQLIDDSGNLNTNLAQTISDSGLLDDASQEALDSLIEYQEEYDDAIEDVKNSLKEVVGSLSDDLYSAVNDAWIDGSDNATAFFDVVNEGLENMVSQIIYTASFSGLFDELQDNLSAIYTNANLSSDEMSSQISSAIYNFYDEASDAMDNYTAGMNIASQTAESMGFDWSDIDTDSSRSGSTSGVESMTQDSADEMNGRLTAIQGMVSTINTNISILIDSNSKILIHMVNIDTNTARLESIETSLTAVKKGIDTINTRGITIK